MKNKIIFPTSIIVAYFNVTIARYNPWFLKILSEALNFNYEFTSPTDNEYGRKLLDGNWTGLIGQVSRGEADIAIADLSPTDARKNVVDFTENYITNELIFTTKFPRTFQKSFNFIQPFQMEVWLLILATLCITAFVMPGFYSDRISYTSSFFNLMFRQPVSTHLSYSKPILGVWLLCTWVLFNYYCCALTSSVVIPTSDVIPRNFEELAKFVSARKFRCMGFFENAGIYKMINDGDSYTKYLGKTVIKNRWFLKIRTEPNSSFSENTAVFMNKVSAYFRYGMPPFSTQFISEDTLIKDPFALAVRKDFCCLEQINIVIRRCKAAGLMNKLFRDAIFINFLKKRLYRLTEDRLPQLTITHLKNNFFILLIGYFISFLVLFIEIAMCKWRNNFLQFKTNLLSFI